MEWNFETNPSRYFQDLKKIKLNQSTNYPWDGKVKLTVEDSDGELSTGFRIRVPGWARNEVLPGNLYKYLDKRKLNLSLSINGINQKIEIKDGYVIVENNYWKSGDIIEIFFEMDVRKVLSNEKVVANRGKIAFERGPLVYCAEEVDNPSGVLDLRLDLNSDFKYFYDKELLGGVGKIIGKAKNINDVEVDFAAIPYYAWAHRDDGEMSVWLKYIK